MNLARLVRQPQTQILARKTKTCGTVLQTNTDEKRKDLREENLYRRKRNGGRKKLNEPGAACPAITGVNSLRKKQGSGDCSTD